jgi:hypothetical protein
MSNDDDKIAFFLDLEGGKEIVQETTIYIYPPHTKTHGESKEEHRRSPRLNRMPLFYFYFSKLF